MCILLYINMAFENWAYVRLIDWVRLNVPPTQYRSYGDGFLRVKWPNQQCQSTEGGCISFLPVFVFRFWRQICSHANYPTTLLVSWWTLGCETFRTCRWTLPSQSSQQRGAWCRQHWVDIVHAEREAVVDAQSQDQRSVWQVPGRTGQHWTTTCPQSHHRTTRSVRCCCYYAPV